MIALDRELQAGKLHARRRQITRTLDHVRGERQAVSENKHWIGRSAYDKRCHLLDSLARWYADEHKRIEAALRRINDGDYGVCLRCLERIDDQRLETAPEATLCARCDDTETLARDSSNV